MQETQVQSLRQEDHMERKRPPTPVFLLADDNPQGLDESDTT